MRVNSQIALFPASPPEREDRDRLTMRILLWLAAVMLSSVMGFCLWLLTK